MWGGFNSMGHVLAGEEFDIGSDILIYLGNYLNFHYLHRKESGK